MTRAYLAILSMLAASSAYAADQPALTPAAGLLQIFLGLAAVLGLKGFAAWSFKKIGPAAIGSKLAVKVVGGVSLGNRERVMVIEVADQWIVVGVTSTQINTLSTMPKQEHLSEQADKSVQGNQFSAWLKRTMDQRKETP
jgi:flagellar protein FliO/FliZ